MNARPAGGALDRFEVFEEIGRGASGVVHRARRRDTGREVALKILVEPPPGPRRDEWLKRLRRESAVAARLDHPQIARVFAFHEGEGRCLLEVELVRGESLSQRLARGGALPPGEALLLVEKLARAMEHAHEHGVVHRDLKPENVVLDARGEPRIVDFGVAKDLETATALSKTGALLGTPAYLSPEQARGDVHDVDGRTDVWSLGVILYELLTGRLPFEGGSVIELIAAIGDREPERPRLPDGRDAGPAGSVALAALRKDRQERPTALELALACARARRPLERRFRGGLALALAAGAFAAGGAAAVLVPSGGEPGPRAPAVGPVTSERPGSLRLASDLGRALESGLARFLPALETGLARDPACREALAQVLVAWPEEAWLETYARDATPTRDRLALEAMLALVEGPGLAPGTRGRIHERRVAVVRRLDEHIRRHLARAASLGGREEPRECRAALDLLWQRLALEPELEGRTARSATALLGAAALARLTPETSLEVTAVFLEAGIVLRPFLQTAAPAVVLARGRALVSAHGTALGALLAAACECLDVAERLSLSGRPGEARALVEGEPVAWLAAFREGAARSRRAGSRSLRQLRAIERFEWARALDRDLVSPRGGTSASEGSLAAALEAVELGYERMDQARLLAARACQLRAGELAASNPRLAFDHLESAVEHARAAHAFFEAVAAEHADLLGAATREPSAELRLLSLDASRLTAVLGDPGTRAEPLWAEAAARKSQLAFPALRDPRETQALRRGALERCVAVARTGAPLPSVELAHVLAEDGETAGALELLEPVLAAAEETYWLEDPARRPREEAFAAGLRARLRRSP